jgi:hypothetical protein
MDDNKKLSEMIELHLELRAKSGEAAVHEDVEFDDVPEAEGLLPPRSTVFPSNKKKLTQIFYNSLFIIFVLLVMGLIYWGFRME